MENKKRISLYFNLDDPEERLIFKHLDERKKSRYIKNLILNDIKNNGVMTAPAATTQTIQVDTLDDCIFDTEAIDLDD